VTLGYAAHGLFTSAKKREHEQRKADEQEHVDGVARLGTKRTPASQVTSKTSADSKSMLPPA
jgi:hypothetical protein